MKNKYYCEYCNKKTKHTKEEKNREIGNKKKYTRIHIYCMICNKENYPYEIYTINNDRINRVLKKKK